MGLLKKILLVLALLIGGALVLALFVGKEMTVKRTAVIEAPIQDVFDGVNDLKAWKEWQPWSMYDENMKMTYPEQTVGAGAYYDWTSENAGNGRMAIKKSTPHKEIETEVAFEGMGTAVAKFSFEQVDKGTQVTWDFFNEVPYPFNLMTYFMGTKSLEDDYDRGLKQLGEYVQKKVEEKAQQTGAEIKMVELPAQHYIGVRKTLNAVDLGTFYQKTFPEVQTLLEKQGVETTGAPTGVFFTFDVDTKETEMLAGIPTATMQDIKGLDAFSTEAGKALVVDYYGSYEESEEVYGEFMAYMAANNLEQRGVAIEEYIIDASQESDPAKWLTRIMFQVKEVEAK